MDIQLIEEAKRVMSYESQKNCHCEDEEQSLLNNVPLSAVEGFFSMLIFQLADCHILRPRNDV